MEKISDLIKASSEVSVAELFEVQVSRNSKSMAVINTDGRIYSYEEFLVRTLKLSSLLLSYGLKPKDRVAIISENRSEYLELQIACAKVGAIVAAINWRLSQDEIQYCIDLVEPELIFFSERFEEKYSCLKLKNKNCIKIESDYEKELLKCKLYSGESIGRGEDPLIILFTSGTTGYPKGAVISHRAVIARIMYCCMEYGINSEDIFPAWPPMFHMASTDLAIGSLIIGGSVAFIDGFKSLKIIQLIKEFKISWLVLMPGMLEKFIKDLLNNPIKPKNIKIMGAMADLIPKKQIVQITSLLRTPYFNSFGSTETGLPPASGSFIPINSLNYSLSKTQSSLCEVKLVNDDDEEVGFGIPGECKLKSPTLFSGYWNAETINKEEFKNGWFHMGDVMKRNVNGSLDFVDRKKYLIKSGGENIYPAEIERVLLSHKNVFEAIVVKSKSVEWGETPVALVAISNEEEFEVIQKELIDMCRNKLAGYKQPKTILHINKEKIPRSTTGKVQRHIVEAMLEGIENK